MNDYKTIANPIELTPLVLKSLGEYIGTNCPGVGMQTETDKLRGIGYESILFYML
jgi:hypothetical protein